jgi:hypothetical protein
MSFRLQVNLSFDCSGSGAERERFPQKDKILLHPLELLASFFDPQLPTVK